MVSWSLLFRPHALSFSPALSFSLALLGSLPLCLFPIPFPIPFFRSPPPSLAPLSLSFPFFSFSTLTSQSLVSFTSSLALSISFSLFSSSLDLILHDLSLLTPLILFSPQLPPLFISSSSLSSPFPPSLIHRLPLSSPASPFSFALCLSSPLSLRCASYSVSFHLPAFNTHKTPSDYGRPGGRPHGSATAARRTVHRRL